jgi:hypothetical protein
MYSVFGFPSTFNSQLTVFVQGVNSSEEKCHVIMRALIKSERPTASRWFCVKWVTRENVHVDRVACPWLIKRFVDPQAHFLFVPPDKIAEVAEKDGAIPYDAKGVELGHHGDKCSFDAIIEKYKLTDPALLELAKIVRAADTDKFELAAESVGLEAIASGSMMLAKDDYEAIEKQSYLYDSLYAYCKLRLIKQKYAKEIEGLDPRQRRAFLRGKVKEQAL